MRRVVHWSPWLPVFLLFIPGMSVSQEERAIEPKAEDVLREMTTLLTGSSAFAFRAEASIDEFHETGLKIQTSARRTMAVRRPDRAASNVDGDRGSHPTVPGRGSVNTSLSISQAIWSSSQPSCSKRCIDSSKRPVFSRSATMTGLEVAPVAPRPR